MKLINAPADYSLKKDGGRLGFALFLFILTALALGGAAFAMKYFRGMDASDMFSFKSIMALFEENRPLISSRDAEKLKSIVTSGGESGGLIIEKPASAGESSLNSPPASADAKGVKYDQIVLRNNDVLNGEIISETLAFETEHGRINFNYSDIIAAYCVYETETPYDKIISKNGDKISGRITGEPVVLKTLSGDVLKISPAKIKIINKNIAGR